MWKKMRPQLIKKVKRAIRIFKLLEDGDKIAIGVSGGKDSTILLYSLYTIKKIWPINFELNSVFLDMGWQVDYSKIKKFSESLDIPFHYVKTDIGEIIFEERKEKNPCSLCSKMRRGALNNYAISINCNKVALGHHMDDCVETLMLSLTYEGRINTFSPKAYLDRSEITIIRPLIFVYEEDIIQIVAEHKLPVAKQACPYDGKSKRQEIKKLIAQMVLTNPLAKDRMMSGITNQIWAGFNENFENDSILRREDKSGN